MLPNPRMNLIWEPDDRPERADFLRALANRQAGRVVCEMRPGAKGLAWLAASVAEGLGKDIDSGGAGRNAAKMWRRAADWMVGEEIAHLFVNRAQLLSASELTSLLDFAVDTDCELWVVFQQTHLRRRHVTLVREWPLRQLDWASFEEIWSDSRAESDEQTSAPVGRFPRIPEDDFTTFLSTCDRVLTRRDLASVEAAFVAGREATQAWIAAEGVGQTDAWAQHLRSLIGDCLSRDEALTRLRGAQVSLFLAGSWLRVDQRLLSMRWESQARLSLDEKLTAALRRFASPQSAAIAVVRAVSSSDPLSIASLRVGDVDEQAVSFRLGRPFEVPSGARGILRAQLAARARAGAQESDGFFIDGKSDAKPSRPEQAMTARGVQRVLRAVGDEIGVDLVGRKSDWGLEDDRTWARRVGLVLRTLENVHA